MSTPLTKRHLELNPFLDSVANRIRYWRSDLDDLKPLALEPELRSIMGSIEGQEVFISNELHSAKGLRKIHLELAIIGSDMQILHCIFFPDPKFDVPIFGTDIVLNPFGITAAIVDLSPVGPKLPYEILRRLEKLKIPSFKQVRDLPNWGRIFSPYVQFIRPNGSLEESLFSKLLDDYLKILLTVLDNTKPEDDHLASTIERYQGQINYCNQQKLNDKTKGVLSQAFSSNWADRYIEKLLFDNPQPLGN